MFHCKFIQCPSMLWNEKRIERVWAHSGQTRPCSRLMCGTTSKTSTAKIHQVTIRRQKQSNRNKSIQNSKPYITIHWVVPSPSNSHHQDYLPLLLGGGDNPNHTLPETNSSPLKMDGWNTILSYWVSAYIQGRNAVSFREGAWWIFTLNGLQVGPPARVFNATAVFGASWDSVNVFFSVNVFDGGWWARRFDAKGPRNSEPKLVLKRRLTSQSQH